MSITIGSRITNDLKRDYTYKDLNFRKDGSINDKNIAVEDLYAIRNSLNNLLTIQKGSRLLDPTYGNELKQFLFEQASLENGNLLGDVIETTLEQEPRILVEEVEITVDKQRGIYEVDIFFSIPSLSIGNQKLSMTVGEGEIGIMP